MKFTVQTTTLKAALAQVGKVIKPRTTIPAIAGVLLEAHVDGGLTLSGTDLESRAMRTVPADVSEAGSVVLPSQLLQSFVGELTGGETTVSVAENRRARITCDRTEITLPGIDPEEFPVSQDFDAPTTDLTIAADVLADALARVVHAVAPDESRPVLAGVLVQIADGTLSLVAADGFRLAMSHVHDLDASDMSVIVSGKPLAALVGALGSATSVRLAVNERGSHLLVDTEIGVWHLRLIDGQFPDFNRIIPREWKIKFTADRVALLAAIKLVAPVAAENTQITRLLASDGLLTVKAISTNESAEAVVDIDVDEGEALAWGVDNRYIRKALEALDSERVTVEVAAVDRPMAIHPGARHDGVQVVMPMHVAR